MILLALLGIVAAFVIVALVGMTLWWFAHIVVTGLIVGGLGRLLLPGAQPIGVLATVLCGLAGSLVGGIIGHGVGLAWWATLLIEIGSAAVAVGIWSTRARHTPLGSGGHRNHRIIDI